MVKSISVGIMLLLAGAAVGWFAHPSAPEVTIDAKGAKSNVHAHKTSSADEASLNRLRARIADLERKLAAAAASSNMVPQVVAAEDKQRPEPFNMAAMRKQMEARMEEMKKNEPERYIEMTNRFARMHANRLRRTEGQLEILASVDTSRLTAEQRQVHERLQDLIVQQEEMREALSPRNNSLTDEQRIQTFESLRELEREMQDLARSERNVLLMQTAKDAGCKGDAAKELVETVKAIYQATTVNGWHHGPRR